MYYYCTFIGTWILFILLRLEETWSDRRSSMDNFISILRDASSPEELEQYKVQLFRENVRIKTDRSELEEMYDRLGIEQKKLEEAREEIENQRKSLNQEMRQIKKELQDQRRRLEEDTIFFEKKQRVLEQSFRQLDLDRQKLESEKKQFHRYREEAKNSVPRTRPLEYRQGIFFKGITNQLALKKRYKDLIKIFHPDNMSGDNDTLQQINREYEILKHDLGIDRQSW